MKLYIVTDALNETRCINQYKPKVFTNYDDAFNSMETDYNSIVNNNLDVQENWLGNIGAHITYKNGQVEYYDLWEVEV